MKKILVLDHNDFKNFYNYFTNSIKYIFEFANFIPNTNNYDCVIAHERHGKEIEHITHEPVILIHYNQNNHSYASNVIPLYAPNLEKLQHIIDHLDNNMHWTSYMIDKLKDKKPLAKVDDEQRSCFKILLNEESLFKFSEFLQRYVQLNLITSIISENMKLIMCELFGIIMTKTTQLKLAFHFRNKQTTIEITTDYPIDSFLFFAHEYADEVSYNNLNNKFTTNLCWYRMNA